MYFFTLGLRTPHDYYFLFVKMFSYCQRKLAKWPS